jgi:hypothetical protein
MEILALPFGHRSEKCNFTCRRSLLAAGEQLTNGKTTSVNVGGLLSPRANLRLHFDAGFEHLALNIEADVLARKLGAIIGSPPSKPILFEVDPEFGHPAVLRLRRMIEFLVEELSSGRRDIPIVALVEMEHALMTWFLVGNRNNYSPLLNGRSQSAAPWQVKRAEEYIEARLGPAAHDRSSCRRHRLECAQSVPCLQAKPRLLANDVSQACAPAACVVSAQMLDIPWYRSRTSLTPADLAISAISPSIFAPSSVKLPPRSCPGLRTACESLFENALRQLALIE